MGSEELGSCGLASVEPLCLFGTLRNCSGTHRNVDGGARHDPAGRDALLAGEDDMDAALALEYLDGNFPLGASVTGVLQTPSCA